MSAVAEGHAERCAAAVAERRGEGEPIDAEADRVDVGLIMRVREGVEERESVAAGAPLAETEGEAEGEAGAGEGVAAKGEGDALEEGDCARPAPSAQRRRSSARAIFSGRACESW